MQCGTHVRPLGPFNSTYLSFHFFLLHFFFAISSSLSSALHLTFPKWKKLMDFPWYKTLESPWTL